jgi:predicted nicotinamide N-methyase
MQATLVAALLTGATAAVQSRRSLLRVGCTTTVTPFASAAACKGDECIKEKRRTFDRAGRTLVVDQEFSTAKQRSTGAGVWECGELLSAKLAAEPGLCKGKTVLELGAGCGLVAMTAALCGATRVVASDGDEGSCAHLADILAANNLREKVTVPPPLRWEAASAESARALGVFDVVLGADVTYNPANADALANALVAHASPSTKIILAHKRRQPADDATIKRLGEFFSITTLATGGSTAEPVSTLELRKTTARLDLDLAGASAANCADGYVRRNGACWLARRSVGGLVAALPAVAVASVPNGVASRFESDALVQPTVDQGRSEFSGVANLYYPDWMAGTWDVEQTLQRAEAPLGLKFIGGPRGDLAIAQKSLDEQRSRIGQPQKLKLRFVRTKFGVVEDRLYNTRSRLDAFAGRAVVSSVEYAETGGNNRRGNVVLGGSADDPLITTVTYYKGPAAQKVFSVARTTEASDDLWRASEATRSIFALNRVEIKRRRRVDGVGRAKFDFHTGAHQHERRAPHHDGLGDPHGAPADDWRRGRRPLAPRRLHEPARPAVLRRSAQGRVDS